MEKTKCALCGKSIKDKHPARKGNKFCCREHWQQFINENGTWNKNKKWDEMYNVETLHALKNRSASIGKNHFNYGRNRPDMLKKNLLNNPSRTVEINKKIQEEYDRNPEKTIKHLLKQSTPKKEIAYQRKAFEKYGRRCKMCGTQKGQIDIHHIDGNHRNNDIKNLTVLCASCHGITHKRGDI